MVIGYFITFREACGMISPRFIVWIPFIKYIYISFQSGEISEDLIIYILILLKIENFFVVFPFFFSIPYYNPIFILFPFLLSPFSLYFHSYSYISNVEYHLIPNNQNEIIITKKIAK